MTDAAGAVVSSVTRDPWGNRVLLAGGDPLDLGYPDRLSAALGQRGRMHN